MLVAVIDHGSLAAAARRLRRSPPAVTRALAALEGRVGVRLVERSTRRLSVTEAGRAFAERARALLTEYDSAVSGLADTPFRGLLRVTAPLQFGRRHVAPLGRVSETYREIQDRADPQRPQSRSHRGNRRCCADWPARGF